jgi:uncharacterized protein (TIGR02611 family)
MADDTNPSPEHHGLPDPDFTLEQLDVSMDDLASPPGRFRAVLRVMWRSTRRIAVTIIGLAVLAAGIAMIVLPGPGIVVIIAGLAILGSEYVWARRLLMIAKDRAEAAKNKVMRKKTDQNDQ